MSDVAIRPGAVRDILRTAWRRGTGGATHCAIVSTGKIGVPHEGILPGLRENPIHLTAGQVLAGDAFSPFWQEEISRPVIITGYSDRFMAVADQAEFFDRELAEDEYKFQAEVRAFVNAKRVECLVLGDTLPSPNIFHPNLLWFNGPFERDFESNARVWELAAPNEAPGSFSLTGFDLLRDDETFKTTWQRVIAFECVDNGEGVGVAMKKTFFQKLG